MAKSCAPRRQLISPATRSLGVSTCSTSASTGSVTSRGRRRGAPGDRAGAGPELPSIAVLGSFPGDLPRQLTSFVGRDEEGASLAAALLDARLVTVTGVGGVGKPRLATQVAADVAPRFASASSSVVSTSRLRQRSSRATASSDGTSSTRSASWSRNRCSPPTTSRRQRRAPRCSRRDIILGAALLVAGACSLRALAPTPTRSSRCAAASWRATTWAIDQRSSACSTAASKCSPPAATQRARRCWRGRDRRAVPRLHLTARRPRGGSPSPDRRWLRAELGVDRFTATTARRSDELRLNHLIQSSD